MNTLSANARQPVSNAGDSGHEHSGGMQPMIMHVLKAVKMTLELNTLISEIRNSDLDMETICSKLSRALECLYSLESKDPQDPLAATDLSLAMHNFRFCLKEIQDTKSDDVEIHEAMRLVAGILALLYPLSRAQQRMADSPDEPAAMVKGPLKPDPRRTHERIRIETDVGIQSDTNFFTGFAEDISRGGIFVATFDVRPIGSKVSLNFSLPGGHLVTATGIIRWIREYNETTPDIHPGVGIQFDGLSVEDSRAINSFFEQRSPLFYEE